MKARVLIGCALTACVFLVACGGADMAADRPEGGELGAEVRQGLEADTGRLQRGGGGGSGSTAGATGSFDAVGAETGGIGYSLDDAAVSQDAPAAAAPRPQVEGPATSAPGIGPSIIKTATVQIAIEGNDFSRAVHEATAVAERYGGYVVSTALDDEGKGFAAATLRIPADKFGAAMGAVRGVGEVQREEISGEDVTQQVIDLEARLRNLRAQETVLLRLMDEAGSVLETIRIQGHLSDVQLEIERLRGRLRYLDDQVSFSTIFVEMRQAGEGPAPKLGVLGRAWQRALGGALSVLGGTIVAFGFALPIGLMLALAALAFRALRPRLRRAPGVG